MLKYISKQRVYSLGAQGAQGAHSFWGLSDDSLGHTSTFFYQNLTLASTFSPQSMKICSVVEGFYLLLQQ